jgi:hypothetical protein
MTGQEHYDKLYDEMAFIVAMLHESFEYEKNFPALKHAIDPEILISRAEAINAVAQEMRYLKKFRGSLGLVK